MNKQSMEIQKWTGERKRVPHGMNVDKMFEKFFEFVYAIKVVELSNGRIILGFIKHEVIPDMREYLCDTMYSYFHVKERDPNKNEKSQFYKICEVHKLFIPSKIDYVVPHIEGEYKTINKDHIVSMDFPPSDMLRKITFT